MRTIPQTIEEQFNSLTLIKVFEISVNDKRTNENEYILFHIFIDNGEFIAKHESLSEAQSKSDKIAFVSIDIDEVFSLHQNLEVLHEECINAIIESDFFILNDK